MRHNHRCAGTIVAIVILLLALNACNAAPAGPQIKVEEAWGRPSPQMMMTGAFYMKLNNSGSEADALVQASSAACNVTEIHESLMNADGTMGMRPVEGGKLAVAAKSVVELKPGGLHVMCIGKTEAFEVGKTISLTLTFEKSGAQTVEVEIRQP